MSREEAERIAGTLPKFPGMADLLEAYGGRDPLLTAYLRGWLPPTAAEVLESDYPRLLCWLAVRLYREATGEAP